MAVHAEPTVPASGPAEMERIHRRQDAWDGGDREKWIAAHDYPRCEHGLSLFADCGDCKGNTDG